MTTTPVAARLAAAGCVYAEDEATVLMTTARTATELEAMVARREAGEPLEHVVGWADFRGLRFTVEAGVFVPRARSDLLVEEAASLVRCLAGPGSAVVVVDLCCGVGAIGGALAAELPHVDLYAADLNPSAVRCARRNLAALGGAVYEGDLFAALPRRLRRRVDVLVASPPYVPTGEIGLLTAEAREYEPLTALDGGARGLDTVTRIAAGACQWLSRDGCLAVEVAPSQVEQAAAIVEDSGFAVRPVTSEDHGAAVVIGRRPHATPAVPVRGRRGPRRASGRPPPPGRG